jgi:hypothetical protein
MTQDISLRGYCCMINIQEALGWRHRYGFLHDSDAYDSKIMICLRDDAGVMLGDECMAWLLASDNARSDTGCDTQPLPGVVTIGNSWLGYSSEHVIVHMHDVIAMVARKVVYWFQFC